MCRNLTDPTLTHESKRAFVAAWIDHLTRYENMDLGRINQRKIEIRNLLENRLNLLRLEAASDAYQECLFGDNAKDRIGVAALSRDYDDSKEEFECAVWLGQQADRGRIDFWVRNLVRREVSSFSLQKSDEEFYPNFVCKLPTDGPILVVEYKGRDKWNTPKVEMDRKFDDLWVNGVRVKQALF